MVLFAIKHIPLSQFLQKLKVSDGSRRSQNSALKPTLDQSFLPFVREQTRRKWQVDDTGSNRQQHIQEPEQLWFRLWVESARLLVRFLTNQYQESTNQLLAWVSGVSGERGKDGSEKRRELKERNAWHRCFYWSLPPPHSMIRYHPIKITSGHWVVSFTCQKARLK